MLSLMCVFIPAVTRKLRDTGVFHPADQRRLSRKYDGYGIPLESPNPDLFTLPNPSRPIVNEDFQYSFLADISPEDLKKYYMNVPSNSLHKTKCGLSEEPYNEHSNGPNRSINEHKEADCNENGSSVDGFSVSPLVQMSIMDQYNSVKKTMGLAAHFTKPHDITDSMDSIWNYDLGLLEGSEDEVD